MKWLLFAITAVVAAALPASSPILNPADIELIPGLGLPSLASLNISMADLVHKAENRIIEKRDDTENNVTRKTLEPDFTGVVNYASLCTEYLDLISDVVCPVYSRTATQFCRRSWVLDDSVYNIIWGFPANPDYRSDDSCGSVSKAAKRIIDQCQKFDPNDEAGWSKAGGWTLSDTNKDLQVVISSWNARVSPKESMWSTAWSYSNIRHR